MLGAQGVDTNVHANVNNNAFNVNDFSAALLQGLNLQRLPAVFTGNMLEYHGWKMNFKLLIENKGLSSADKMYYLKRYLGGKAKKAVEGFFYSSTQDSYIASWNVLEKRYNHPFLLLEAYRQKLASWPDIKGNDGDSLQMFADFLNACKDAMSHIPDLSILNDCKENQKLLRKLPGFLVSRRTRKVDGILNEERRYPTFAEFADIISVEARILCNPVLSTRAMRQSRENESQKHEIKSHSASVFASASRPDTLM